METMTVQELHDALEKMINEGRGDKPCLYMATMLNDLSITVVQYLEKGIPTRDAVYLGRYYE